MRGKTGKRACAQGCEGNEPGQFREKFTANPASGGSGGAVYAHCELRKQKYFVTLPGLAKKSVVMRSIQMTGGRLWCILMPAARCGHTLNLVARQLRNH